MKLTGKHPAEVQPLIDSLNTLLVATNELVQRARTQAGNIAHGLKTPLAILTDEAYRLQQQGQGTSAATILDQCRRMQTQIDYQTARARIVANRLSPSATADLKEAAVDIVGAVSRLYKHKGIEFQLAVTDGLKVACDKQDLQELLGNLVDNAGKHANSRVAVTAKPTEDGAIAIDIADDGPGLPPEAYEVVFNVGERWDTQEQGTGLGLAIARDLATLYGGTIKLGTSTLGGLLASLRLPDANRRLAS